MNDLQTFCLKRIAKDPVPCLLEESIKRAKKINGDYIACVDRVVAAVTDAGKLGDSIATLEALIAHPSRRKLSVRNSKLSEGRLRPLFAAQLLLVDLTGILAVQDETVLCLLRTCPSLLAIRLTNCRKLTDAALRHIQSSAQKLTSIRIGGNFNMTAEGIYALVASKKVSSLEDFAFSGIEVSPALAQSLASRLPSKGMRSLGISYTNISDAALRSILSPLAASLESLTIGWNANLLSNDLLDFLSAFPRLTELDINGLKVFTAAHIADFLNKRLIMVRTLLTLSVQ